MKRVEMSMTEDKAWAAYSYIIGALDSGEDCPFTYEDAACLLGQLTYEGPGDDDD